MPLQNSATAATPFRIVRRLGVAAYLASILWAAVATAQEEHRPLRAGGLGAEAAALLISGQEGGSVPLFAVAVAGVAGAEAKARVELFVEAQGEALLAGHEAGTMRIELCLYALQGARVAGASLETVELDLQRDREHLLAAGVKLRSSLELDAGEYQLRILVRNVETGELGLRSYALTIPAEDSETVLQPLLVPDPADGWLRLTRQAGAPAIGFWPAARPVLAPEQDSDLHILVRGLEPDSARLEIAGAGGRAIEVPATVIPGEHGAPPGLDHWQVRTRIPRLEPGDYEMRLLIADVAASPRLPIVVRSRGEGNWARAGVDPAPAAAPAEPAPLVRQRRGGRRAASRLRSRFAEGYRGVLSRLAAADTMGAVAELTALETEAFELEGGQTAIAGAEIEIARTVYRAAARGLPPLFDLHYRAYRHYLGARRFRLSSHAREQLLTLIDLYLAGHPADPTPATDMLVVLANQLQRSGLARFSAVIFRRALLAEPAHEGALLGLAAGLEKHGEYREACDVLEQLVAAQPEHREARLRLGVNLMRLGNRSRARRLFSALVESAGEDWVLAVAYHELIRDHLRREEPDEAGSLLAAGIERLPDDDQLRLLHAVLWDMLPAGVEGEETELALRSRADRPSARHIYQEWPDFAPAGGREAEGARLEALAAALQGLGGAA